MVSWLGIVPFAFLCLAILVFGQVVEVVIVVLPVVVVVAVAVAVAVVAVEAGIEAATGLGAVEWCVPVVGVMRRGRWKE